MTLAQELREIAEKHPDVVARKKVETDNAIEAINYITIKLHEAATEGKFEVKIEHSFAHLDRVKDYFNNRGFFCKQIYGSSFEFRW